jgi:hypothetical protein
MRAKKADFGIVVRTAGGPEMLQWAVMDTPTLGPGKACIAQRAWCQLYRHLLSQGHLSVADDTFDPWRRSGWNR